MKKMLNKIFWRIKFVFFESWGKDPRIILYTVFPFARKEGFRFDLLKKKKFIEYKEKDNIVVCGDIKFYCGEHIPVADIISLCLPENKYIKKNFINNKAFKLEGPYENKDFYVEEGDYVVDAGANIGLFSLLTSKKTGREGKIFAFEPIKATGEIFSKNILLNKFNNIKIISKALGDKEDVLNFSVDESILGNSSNIMKVKGGEVEKVEQTTLDSFVKNNEIRKINFIKADIEGMERQLLLGARETIQRFKPKLAICIYHLPDDPEIIEKMILEFVPEYKISKTKHKIFAWV